MNILTTGLVIHFISNIHHYALYEFTRKNSVQWTVHIILRSMKTFSLQFCLFYQAHFLQPTSHGRKYCSDMVSLLLVLLQTALLWWSVNILAAGRCVCVPRHGISSMSQQRLMVFVTFRLFRLVPKRKTWNFRMAGLQLSFCFLANYIWRWTRPGNGITFAHFPLPSLAWQPRWDETKLAPGLYSTESTLEIDSQRLAWQSVGQTCIIQYV